MRNNALVKLGQDLHCYLCERCEGVVCNNCGKWDCSNAGPEGADERNFMQDKPFREAVGDLLWLSRLYRNDIAHAVAALSRVAHNPGKSHWIALQHLLQYLRHTRHFKLVYKKTHKPMDDYVPTVESYSDSDWAPNYGTKYNNYRSTTGNVTLVDGNPIHWRSRRQQRAALSSNEAEYYAAAEAAKDCIYISRISQSLAPDKTKVKMPVLKLDSKTAVTCAKNPADNENQRHIDLRSHFLRECCARRDFDIVHIPGSQNPADTLTKSLGETKFAPYRTQLRVIDPASC